LLNPLAVTQLLSVKRPEPENADTMNTEQQSRQFADGEVYFWLEQDSSIMLKAASAHGDPVELTADETRAIASALPAMAQKLEALNLPKE